MNYSFSCFSVFMDAVDQSCEMFGLVLWLLGSGFGLFWCQDLSCQVWLTNRCRDGGDLGSAVQTLQWEWGWEPHAAHPAPWFMSQKTLAGNLTSKRQDAAVPGAHSWWSTCRPFGNRSLDFCAWLSNKKQWVKSRHHQINILHAWGCGDALSIVLARTLTTELCLQLRLLLCNTCLSF